MLMSLPPDQRPLPRQDAAVVQFLADRWNRAAQAHQRWAEPAKKCVDYAEGRQWTEEQLRKLASEKRPALTFNIIAPLLRLVAGYHRNNRTDWRFLPGYDGSGTEDVSELLNRLGKQASELNGMPFKDAEVFMDGLMTGRGFIDDRLDYSSNILGEYRSRPVDPFSVYIDPDGDTYDLNESCNDITVSRWVSLDEVERTYSRQAADLVRPFVNGQTPLGPITYATINEESTPVRSFGQREDWARDYWDTFYSQMGEFYDPFRKTMRLLDTQYYITERKRVFLDLETGDWKMVPDHWDNAKVEKVLYWAQQRQNPLIVTMMDVRRVRWTQMIGDVLVYDRWSPYSTFTITGYFPWFRRGSTRGMVQDLIDPQTEKNVRRSSRVHVAQTTANSGWMVHEESVTPEQRENILRNGAKQGVMVVWKGDPNIKPERITSGASDNQVKMLEEDGEDDVRKIAGINESALGELDRVQSGRAIEARQRQAVIAIQMYMDNFSRTKELQGRKFLEIVQNHYTEQRTFRILGEDGKFTLDIINKQAMDPATGVIGRLNDVTTGKYTVAVDETPLSASFAEGQFQDLLMVLEKLGPVLPMAQFGDLLLDATNIPRKEEWTKRFQEAMGLLGQPAGAQPGVPAGGAPVAAGPAPGPAPSLDQAAMPGGNVVPLSPTAARPGM